MSLITLIEINVKKRIVFLMINVGNPQCEDHIYIEFSTAKIIIVVINFSNLN